jgi:translocation and assembly module TamB
VRRRGWIVASLVLVGLLGTLAFLVHRLLFTQAGLDFALRQLDRLQGLTIEVTGAEGTLAGPLAADRIVVDHAAVHIDARGLRVVARPRTLLAGRITLTELSIAQITVRLKERPEQPKTKPHFLPAGLSISAPGFRVGDIDVTLQGGQHIVAREASGTLALTRWRLDLDPISVQGPQGQLAGSLALRATEPLGLRTNLRGDWRLPGDAFEYRFRVETRGKLDRLGAELYLDAPAKLSFSGTLLDLTENPRARGTFRLVDFDGSPWMPPERIPRLSGTVTLAAGRNGLGFDGTLTSPALPGQQVRLQGSGRLAERTIEVASFRVWLPRLGSAFTSSGKVRLAGKDAPEGTLPRLELAGNWSALRWPLDEAAEPVVSSPQGVYTFSGALPYDFTARAEVTGPTIPRTSLEVGGALDKQGLVLERVDGYTLRGRVQGRGRLQWTGEQPWRFDVDARSLALGELRRGVDGHIDVTASIAGKGLSATAPWTAQVASLSGTMFGRPLTGRGEIAHRDGVFALRRVRVANGASFADVDGTVGARTLALDWNVDLRSLAVVANGMSGQLVSRGTAHGTLQRPQVTATARVRQFAFGGIAVGLAEADADVDSSDQRRSRVTIDAETITVGGMGFDTVRAGLEGLMRDHELTFAFSSPGDETRRILEFRGGLQAQGSVDLAQRTWAGNLVQADVVFPDGDARLIQPAALTLGADLQRASPLCLRTGDDARLCVEGEYRPSAGAWRVIYSAQDWPLKRILRTFFGWREFDGRLQASGWAEQVPGKPWVGGSTVLVHEPTFDMPRNKFRSERIQLGSSRLDLFAEPDAMRAQLDLQIDESTQVSGEAFVDRRPDLLASPVRGRIEGRSQAIKVLPLLVPEIDRAEGKLEGEITLAGTLGEPQFNGNFQLRDGRLELYRTNLILTAWQADGAFTGDELRFDASGQTARGKLTVDGNFGWPQGVLTGAMRMRGEQLLVADTLELRIVASPNIVLTAGAEGYDVEGEVLIPSARISPRELTTTVNASPDERIVGLPDVEQDTEPSTTNRIRSRIKVALGDAVRVEAYGLKARLAGDVTVSTVPDDIARGNGTISVVDGQYKAFGQDVKITKGLLRYANAPLNEPQLEIVAEREIKDSDITVAVNVRGTLDNPFISITSTPAMSSNEALSYLLTGRSIDTLQSGEAANVNQAAESLAVSGGGLLLGGIGTKLGLDEVSVERTGEEDTQVVLGKALSTKLFVSYGISIAEAINTIKLRYTLNDRWSVKAEAGLEQSADFEYRIER